MPEKKPTICLAIIAKNEGGGIMKAIASARDFVDEVIVSVDSKSTDDTMEKAKKYADRVFTHKWKGSFAQARNELQKKATTDWVLWLDGHEFVREHGKLEEALKKEVDGLFTQIVMENGFTFYFQRIIKKEIEWQHKVHNTPKSKKNTKYKEFVIIHDRIHGQSKEGQKIREEQRNQMLEENLGDEARKDKRNARANFYMANLNLDTGKYKKAVWFYKRCAKYSKSEAQAWLAHYNASICYNELKKHWRAVYELNAAEKIQPNRWETAKMLGVTHTFLGWFEKATHYLVDSFKINTGEFRFNPIIRNDAQTWDYLGICFLEMKEEHKAKIAWKRALEVNGKSEIPLLPAERVRLLQTLLGETTQQTQQQTPIEVCFLVYQRPERVPKILQQLKNQTTQNFKVNIWNNSGQELDTSDFPQNRIQVINSEKNVGSQARFKLAKRTTGNPIIFFDDDEDLAPNFVDYNYREHLKFGPKIILGWFTRTFNKESYWKSDPAKYSDEVDYIATKAMILDRAIIDNEPLLQNIPEDFVKVEDLYLCYLARMKHNMKMMRIQRTTTPFVDNKDQWQNIDKEKAFQKLRAKDWWLLCDNIEILQGLKFKVRPAQWDRQVLWSELGQDTYLIPEKTKIVVDIGAHIGGTTILCASKGAEVFAYEPEEKNFELLQENVKLNGLENKIHCFQKAIGNPGKRTLYLNPENSGMGTFLKEYGHTQEVETISIKKVFEKIPHCDFLKIDCEGAEYEFIKDIPFEKVKTIALELHKGNQQEIVDLLKEHYAVKYKTSLNRTGKIVVCEPKENLEKQVLANLQELKEVCDSLEIPFSLAHGTLLGAYRDNDFIKNEASDTDITIDEKHESDLPKITAELEKRGFRTRRLWQYQGKYRAGQVIKGVNHIDILVVFKKGNDAYVIGPKTPVSNKPYTAYVYPRHCFEKTEKIKFKGMEFNTPTKPEDFFEARYGKNWKMPRTAQQWNYLNPNENPSLRPDYDL